MARLAFAVCYIGATILDQSVGSLWRLGGGSDEVEDRSNATPDTVNRSAEDEGFVGGGQNRNFE